MIGWTKWTIAPVWPRTISDLSERHAHLRFGRSGSRTEFFIINFGEANEELIHTHYESHWYLTKNATSAFLDHNHRAQRGSLGGCCLKHGRSPVGYVPNNTRKPLRTDHSLNRTHFHRPLPGDRDLLMLLNEGGSSNKMKSMLIISVNLVRLTYRNLFIAMR